MTNRRFGRLTVALLALALGALAHPGTAAACAVCYGQSDAPMAQGMNWGIMALLGVIGTVLALFSAFFVFLAKKAGSVAALSPASPAAHINPDTLES